MDIKEYDVFVIGSGVAGQKVAATCAKEGLKVAIADNREYGGTCANRGCDPKKILLGPTEVYEMAKNLEKKNILEAPKLHWRKIQKFKNKYVTRIPPATESKLKDLGIALYHRSPRFVAENALSVEGKTVKASKIVIATGLVPRTLKFKGNDLLLNSDDFMQLKKLPKKLVFIGAGYIGMELAHMAARNGSKVTVVDNGDAILKLFDKDMAVELTKASKELGIRFIFNAQVKKIIKGVKNHQLTYEIAGKEKSLKAHCFFNTAGRVPAVGALDLKKGNVAFSDTGIAVNGFLQNSGNKNVYACGDVSAHSVPLTPLSGIEAKVVAENIIYGNRKKIDIPLVPSVVFTLPNLASVGLSEEEAKSRYKNVIVNYASASGWYNAKSKNVPFYSYKILVNQRDRKIVGAHILGPQAAETINLFTLIINQKMTVNDVKNTIFTYPSWSNDIKSMV